MTASLLIAAALLLPQQAQPDFEDLYAQAYRQRRTPQSARDLALYLANRGEFAKAAPYLEQTLAASPGDGGVPEATALHNWAVAVEESDPESAVRLYREALAIRERELAPLNADLATTRMNLAGLLLADGGKQAEALARQALTAFEKTLGPRHERTGVACGTLGAAVATRGDIVLAERLFRRALSIKETPEALENLADLLAQTGREAAARPLLERAEAIRAKRGKQP